MTQSSQIREGERREGGATPARKPLLLTTSEKKNQGGFLSTLLAPEDPKRAIQKRMYQKEALSGKLTRQSNDVRGGAQGWIKSGYNPSMSALGTRGGQKRGRAVEIT